MSIDVVVLLAIAAGTIVRSGQLRARGARGTRWLLATWVAFFGFTLTAMMAAHSLEIAYHVVRGDTRITGERWAYDFHFYGLQLLGAVLVWQGSRCLRAARLVSAGDVAGLQVVRRAAIITLAVAVPLIPIQAFFGTIVSVLSAITVVASLKKTS